MTNVLYEYGPTGIRYICNRKEACARRIVWLFFTSFGLLYTGIVIWKNIALYRAHSASMVTEYKGRSRNVVFPRVTLCLNSMHSKQKLLHIDRNLTAMMKFVYKGHPAWKSDQNETMYNILEKYDTQAWTRRIFTRTNPVVAFLACSYRGFDCRAKWNKVLTKYGYCRQLHPQSLIDKEASNNLILAVTVAYNESDRTIGRHHSIRDFSIYLDKHDENKEIVNVKTRVHIINKIGVPVINLQQHHKRFLGIPFSRCIEKDPVKHPENDFYTRETCREYGYAERVSKLCNCRMPYWPQNFNFTMLPLCTMKNHIFCIGQIDHAVSAQATCPIECSTITYNKHIIFDGPHEHNIEQLRKLNGKGEDDEDDDFETKGLTVATAMVNLDDESEFELVERPDVTSNQFVADVGGAAGFMLGISVATILAVIDFAVAKVWLAIRLVARLSVKVFKPRWPVRRKINRLRHCGTQNDFQHDFFKNDAIKNDLPVHYKWAN